MTSIFKRNKYKEIDIYYSDFDPGMSKNYQSDTSMAINNKSIEIALQKLLLTTPGTVPFRPLFGTDLSSILFETMSLIQGDRMRTRIISAINSFEPRVIIQDVKVNPDTNNNIYNVYIKYKVRYNNVDEYTLRVPIQSQSNI